jgi:hypothetical protein
MIGGILGGEAGTIEGVHHIATGDVAPVDEVRAYRGALARLGIGAAAFAR